MNWWEEGKKNLKTFVVEVGLWQRFEANILKIQSKDTTTLTITFSNVTEILFCSILIVRIEKYSDIRLWYCSHLVFNLLINTSYLPHYKTVFPISSYEKWKEGLMCNCTQISIYSVFKIFTVSLFYSG